MNEHYPRILVDGTVQCVACGCPAVSMPDEATSMHDHEFLDKWRAMGRTDAELEALLTTHIDDIPKRPMTFIT